MTENATLRYVAQDCYVFGFPSLDAKQILYSDGATSCALVVAEGKSESGESGFALAHVSRPAACREFLEICRRRFEIGLKFHFRGCNPSSNEDAQALIEFVTRFRALSVSDQLSMPSWGNQGDLLGSSQAAVLDGVDFIGIDVDDGCFLPERRVLTDRDRDPSGGFAMLFGLFHFDVPGSPVLLEAGRSYANLEPEIVAAADRVEFAKVLEMDDYQLRKAWSTTPQHESPWFAEAVRNAARFVLLRTRESAEMSKRALTPDE